MFVAVWSFVGIILILGTQICSGFCSSICQLRLAEINGKQEHLRKFIQSIAAPALFDVQPEFDFEALWIRQVLRAETSTESSEILRSLDGMLAMQIFSNLPGFLKTNTPYSLRLDHKYIWEAGTLKEIQISIVALNGKAEIAIGSLGFADSDMDSEGVHSISFLGGSLVASRKEISQVFETPIRLLEVLEYRRVGARSIERMKDFPDLMEVERLYPSWILRPLMQSVQAPRGTLFSIELKADFEYTTSGEIKNGFFELRDLHGRVGSPQLRTSHLIEPSILIPEQLVDRFPSVDSVSRTPMKLHTLPVIGIYPPVQIEGVIDSSENLFYTSVHRLPNDLLRLYGFKTQNQEDPSAIGGHEIYFGQVHKRHEAGDIVHTIRLYRESLFQEETGEPELERFAYKGILELITHKDATSELILWVEVEEGQMQAIARLAKFKGAEIDGAGWTIVAGLNPNDVELYVPYSKKIIATIINWAKPQLSDWIVEANGF